jgi:predicted lipoprotein with Yx(FWY)xxD motif
MLNKWLAPAGLTAAALVVAACGSSSSSGAPASTLTATPSSASTTTAGTTLQTQKIGSATVLANGKGDTVYWFALDTPAQSKCNGTCASYWPPVPGPAHAMAGVSGKLGVIVRKNGAKQATYNGHPLYTYISDTAPGQDKGNGLNLSGGVWHAVVISGSLTPAPKPSKSSSGAYGY